MIFFKQYPKKLAITAVAKTNIRESRAGGIMFELDGFTM